MLWRWMGHQGEGASGAAVEPAIQWRWLAARVSGAWQGEGESAARAGLIAGGPGVWLRGGWHGSRGAVAATSPLAASLLPGVW
jgi:hypothetical protein